MNPWVAVPTFLATLAWFSVVVWYSVRAKWWKSQVGVNTMGISFFIFIALVRLTYTHLDGIPPGDMPFLLNAFGFVIYMGLAFFGFQRTYLIEESQRQKKQAILDGRPKRRWDDPK